MRHNVIIANVVTVPEIFWCNLAKGKDKIKCFEQDASPTSIEYVYTYNQRDGTVKEGNMYTEYDLDAGVDCDND